MNKQFNTAVIGGGVSGLITALELLGGNGALNGKDVLILERTDRVGKKLVATGNGQGNLTNSNMDSKFYHGEPEFISEFLRTYKNVELEKYLSDLGIELIESPDGKKYPVSKQASAVLDILRAYLEYKNCTIITSQKVDKIVKKGDIFTLYTENATYSAKNVVMATGGKAGKQFGTDGTSYGLAEGFGHKTTELYPSLVQLKTELEPIRGLKGLKERARITVLDKGKEIASSVGDLLFTEFGISGSAVFSVSGYALKIQSAIVKIEFLPDLEHKQLTKLIEKRKAVAYIKEQDILCGLVNKRIGQAVLKYAKGNDTENIVNALKDFRLKVTGSLGFNFAQVTKGGIQTSKINPKTYESKLVKNFYIVGETLDVDGDCGGYNITFALVSGITAGRTIKNNLRENR